MKIFELSRHKSPFWAGKFKYSKKWKSHFWRENFVDFQILCRSGQCWRWGKVADLKAFGHFSSHLLLLLANSWHSAGQSKQRAAEKFSYFDWPAKAFTNFFNPFNFSKVSLGCLSLNVAICTGKILRHTKPKFHFLANTFSRFFLLKMDLKMDLNGLKIDLKWTFKIVLIWT